MPTTTQKTDTYRLFERAVAHLQAKGYSADRLLELAEVYGYDAFANLAPASSDPVEDQPSTPTEPTPEGVDYWPSVTLAKYQEGEGVDFPELSKYADALEYVERGQPQLAEVLEDVRADVRIETYRVKHWLAVIGALETDQQSWSHEQDSRRRQLIERVKGEIQETTDVEDRQEIDEAHDKIAVQAERLNPEALGEWLVEGVSVQPWQKDTGLITDWIEVSPPNADYI